MATNEPQFEFEIKDDINEDIAQVFVAYVGLKEIKKALKAKGYKVTKDGTKKIR